MLAEVVTIGDEICRGEIVDSNAAQLAAELWEAQITVSWMTSCCDVAADIRDALTRAAARSQLVVVSGGLGPTEDDLTVDVVSDLLSVVAVVDAASRQRVEQYYQQIGREFSPTSLRQVRIPAGALVHGNPEGAAPCFEVVLGQTPAIFLPGPPREIAAILRSGLVQRFVDLRRHAPGAMEIARAVVRVFGLGESAVAERLDNVERFDGDSVHYQASFPYVLVKLVVRRPSREEAEQRLESFQHQVCQTLDDFAFEVGARNLPVVVSERLLECGVTVATAESCTGGLVSALLTEHAGASGYYLGGVVCYSNAEKTRQLGVDAELLKRCGAVSEEVVGAMSREIRRQTGADFGLAISGTAGPAGGTADKPVGTVWLSLCDIDGPVCHRYHFGGGRDRIRVQAAHTVLDLLRRRLVR